MDKSDWNLHLVGLFARDRVMVHDLQSHRISRFIFAAKAIVLTSGV